MQGLGGILQVDGYAGYNRLVSSDRIGRSIQLAHCWAHARCKLIEITRTEPAPIAEEGVAPIRDLYAIEAEIPTHDWPPDKTAPPRSSAICTPCDPIPRRRL